MKFTTKILRWFDEAHEQLGWLVAVTGLVLTALAVVALLRGHEVTWQVIACLVCLVALGCVTLLGTQRYRGLSIGRGGVRFGDASTEEREEPTPPLREEMEDVGH